MGHEDGDEAREVELSVVTGGGSKSGGIIIIIIRLPGKNWDSGGITRLLGGMARDGSWTQGFIHHPAS